MVHKPIKYKYSDQELKEEAKKYSSRGDFKKLNKKAYEQALKRKLINQICAHMFPVRKSYTLKEYVAAWKSCGSLTEFRIKFYNLMQYGRKKERQWNDYCKEKYGYKKHDDINSVGELSIRFYLEKVFLDKFPKSNPSWLINPRTGRRLQLDGYCSKLKIAFEYQGEQHFNPKHYRYDENIKFRDRMKRKLCIENGVRLIVIKDVLHKKGFNSKELKDKVKKECLRLNIEIPKHIDEIDLEMKISSKKVQMTDDEIIKLARKYKLRTHFIKANHSLYKQLIRYKKWDMVSRTVWSIPKFITKNKWTKESICLEAKKYKSRTEFKNAVGKAYLKASMLGILDEACSHMISIRNTKRK